MLRRAMRQRSGGMGSVGGMGAPRGYGIGGGGKGGAAVWWRMAGCLAGTVALCVVCVGAAHAAGAAVAAPGKADEVRDCAKSKAELVSVNAGSGRGAVSAYGLEVITCTHGEALTDYL